ncbi:peptidoglycan-recognition protein LB-like isoform X3 [Rhynchophorus ferrugineus]|uniref:peptidoglycan-recognition protein LB-like isoform X3 n=1 Tax=Rhynchophorus ferrugineus TaxID=354439 RepID=UPI003FCCBB98
MFVSDTVGDMGDNNEKNCQKDQGINCLICRGPEFVSRDDWGARPPTQVETMQTPVPFVVIHHTYRPEACYNKDDCIKAMQWMQDLHQLNNSWNDIGYSFAAGGDNRIYVGRGWTSVGAHAPKYNDKSIGITLIGDWSNEVPPLSQLIVVKQLILIGIREGYIREDYKLIGHRQVRDTECPGDALYGEIQTWPHWVADPTADYDLPIFKDGFHPDPATNDVGEHNKLKRHNLDRFGSA